MNRILATYSLIYSFQDNTMTYIKSPCDDGSSIECIRFHRPNDKITGKFHNLYLISGDAKGDIQIWSLDIGWVRSLRGHRDRVLCIRALGDVVASSSMDATIMV